MSQMSSSVIAATIAASTQSCTSTGSPRAIPPWRTWRSLSAALTRNSATRPQSRAACWPSLRGSARRTRTITSNWPPNCQSTTHCTPGAASRRAPDSEGEFGACWRPETSNIMQRRITPMACKPWTLNGLSDRLIVGHYENNYGAAVRSLNSIWGRLAELDAARTPDYEIRALKQAELSAMGSVALHELYFGSLGGDGAVLFTGSGSGTKLDGSVSAALAQNFSSLAAWQRDFVALANALSSGSGWAVLTFSRQDGKLYNQLAFDDSQALLDAVPLLVLDMYEHAYQMEFGANAAAYIEAFMRNVDWTAVANRLKQATDRAALVPANSSGDSGASISAEELVAQRATGASLQIIDARPRFH